jgi:hypothetical protein
MYRHHSDRLLARADRPGNFEFEDVVRRRKEAGAEAGEPFLGIGDMDPRSWTSTAYDRL